MRPWSVHLPDGTLSYRAAEPDDEDLDAFTSGTTAEAAEVDHYFRTRAWFDAAKSTARPPTYQLGVGNDVIGYLSISFANKPHPAESSPEKTRYLVIYVLGLHARFHGVENPLMPGERYSETVLRAVETHFSRQKAGCVGLYLRVRQTNVRAVAYYRRLGFVEDPGGPVTVDGGEPQLVMRKLFEEPTS